MKKIIKSKKNLLALAIFLASAACAQTAPSSIGNELFKNLADVKDMVEVPDGPYHAVQSKDGGILFVSSTGRFVLGGVAFDVWNKKMLKSVDDMRYAFNHVDLKSFGVNMAEIKPIEIGTGTKEVTFFVDPNCMWCHRLIEETLNDQALLKEYKFNVLVVPALGNASFEKTKRLYCAKETKQEVLLDALMHDKTQSLEQQEGCDTKGLNKRLVVSDAIGVKSVPFIISSDKRFTKGKPKNLKAWLEMGEKENERQAKIYREAIKEAAAKLTQSNPMTVRPAEGGK